MKTINLKITNRLYNYISKTYDIKLYIDLVNKIISALQQDDKVITISFLSRDKCTKRPMP